MRFVILLLLIHGTTCAFAAQQLADTKPLTIEGDIASQLVDGVDEFLLRELADSVKNREQHWNREFDSAEAYSKSLEPNRKRLAHILGVRGKLVPFKSPDIIATVDDFDSLLSDGGDFGMTRVSWPVVDSLRADGLLLTPVKPIVAEVVLIPDADQSPEELANTIGATLAVSGCQVLIVRTVSRSRSKRNGRANLTNREYLHRSAFVLGRTLIGYETQMVLAGVNWFANNDSDRPIGVMGHGEGGMAAMFAAAIDPRVDAICATGFFGPRERSWTEPLERNLFEFLSEFGGAEILSMLANRAVVLAAADGPSFEVSGDGAAPAKLLPVNPMVMEQEVARARRIVQPMNDAAAKWVVIRTPQGAMRDRPLIVPAGDDKLAVEFITERDPAAEPEIETATKAFCRALGVEPVEELEPPAPRGKHTRSPEVAEAELVQHIDQYNQWLLSESQFVRKQFMKKLDTSSPEAYAKTVEPYRTHFAEKTIGRFDHKLLPFNARSRLKYDEPKWTGHEVVLDVFPDVIAYGIVLLPKGMKPDEKRPVVVCQHGLEGRPTDTIEGNHRAYHDFAAKLCERGFIVFAPQNPYIFKDRFRTLQRKANPLGKTLFSIIVPQHQQIVNWLKSLPNVDSKRIAFYGLSYGGKSAMRIPPLVPDYCLSICSADFNEWVRKNASTRENFSYVWTGEYEIFEFDLGSTFNYAEMAALIAPRPFMVERGHFDGVGTDEWVAFEFARVRNLYAARLKIPDRCEIEWFDGPHTINGKGTFAFLHKHLKWPVPE